MIQAKKIVVDSSAADWTTELLIWRFYPSIHIVQDLHRLEKLSVINASPFEHHIIHTKESFCRPLKDMEEEMDDTLVVFYHAAKMMK